MPRFKVKSRLEHDGKLYAVGEMVDMSAAQAAAIPWAVEAVVAAVIPQKNSKIDDDKADKK